MLVLIKHLRICGRLGEIHVCHEQDLTQNQLQRILALGIQIDHRVKVAVPLADSNPKHQYGQNCLGKWKYNGQQKCTSSHVTQETEECAFEEVMRRMIAQREHVIASCRLAVKEVLDAGDLRIEQEGLEEKMLLLNERIRRLVNDNARTEVDQESTMR